MSYGEDRCWSGRYERRNPTRPAGVLAMACMEEESIRNTGSPGGEGA